MRYQIVYCKRGWPLTTWADNADRARKWPNSSEHWLFRRCGQHTKDEHKTDI